MRRAFLEKLTPGTVRMTGESAHHLRDVLRLAVGDEVELFDAAGNVAVGRIIAADREGLGLQVGPIRPAGRRERMVTIASAVPKADRADWLVEKLSEIGVARWVPLRTARSVVHPEGVAKYERWRRLAIEAAKQSRRPGVMTIDDLSTPAGVLASAMGERAIVLSTRPASRALPVVLSADNAPGTDVTMLVGPEGGWTEDELSSLSACGAVEASLGSTVLRIETAAVVAAGVITALRQV